MQVERYDIAACITAERRRGSTSVRSEVEYQWVRVGEGEGEGEVLEQAVMIIAARKLEKIEGRVVAYLFFIIYYYYLFYYRCEKTRGNRGTCRSISLSQGSP